MKTVTKSEIIAGGAAALVGLSAAVMVPPYALAASATLPMVVEIVRAIEITVTTSLNFGQLAVTDINPGIASIDPASGNVTVDGNGGLSFAGGTPRPGRLRVRGAPFPINVSLQDLTIQLTNGLTRLTMDDFNFLTANAGPRVTVTPGGPHNSAILPIGASVRARAGQLSGTYTGTNTVFANYQ